jgi:hypothetical protein
VVLGRNGWGKQDRFAAALLNTEISQFCTILQYLEYWFQTDPVSRLIEEATGEDTNLSAFKLR